MQGRGRGVAKWLGGGRGLQMGMFHGESRERRDREEKKKTPTMTEEKFPGKKVAEGNIPEQKHTLNFPPLRESYEADGNEPHLQVGSLVLEVVGEEKRGSLPGNFNQVGKGGAIAKEGRGTRGKERGGEVRVKNGAGKENKAKFRREKQVILQGGKGIQKKKTEEIDIRHYKKRGTCQQSNVIANWEGGGSPIITTQERRGKRRRKMPSHQEGKVALKGNKKAHEKKPSKKEKNILGFPRRFAHTRGKLEVRNREVKRKKGERSLREKFHEILGVVRRKWGHEGPK